VSSKLRLFEDYDGTVYEVELPLTSSVDAKAAADELGLPGYVDLSNLTMARAVVAVWAALRAPQLENLPEALRRSVKRPIVALIFGGAAVKVLSPKANEPGHPLNRQLNDIDFAVRKRDGAIFVKLLTNLNAALGSKYTFFTTSGDRWFNALRGGKRYRVHGIGGVEGNGLSVSVIDVFCEELPFRHTIKLDSAFEKAHENLFTVGAERLLLSKLQYIFGLPRDRLPELEAAGQGFRLLPYDHLKGMVAVGMELKDMKDVAALLLDRKPGEGIDLETFKSVLGRDKRFTLTVRLNLENFARRVDILVEEGLTRSEAEAAADGALELLEVLPKVEAKWSKPWWNLYVESPGLGGVK